jgi:bacterioferritin-associated ferredoxin
VIVCICEAVSAGKVSDHLAQGVCSVEEVGRACGAGTDCGACKDVLQQMISRFDRRRAMRRAMPIAAK